MNNQEKIEELQSKLKFYERVFNIINYHLVQQEGMNPKLEDISEKYISEMDPKKRSKLKNKYIDLLKESEKRVRISPKDFLNDPNITASICNSTNSFMKGERNEYFNGFYMTSVQKECLSRLQYNSGTVNSYSELLNMIDLDMQRIIVKLESEKKLNKTVKSIRNDSNPTYNEPSSNFRVPRGNEQSKEEVDYNNELYKYYVDDINKVKSLLSNTSMSDPKTVSKSKAQNLEHVTKNLTDLLIVALQNPNEHKLMADVVGMLEEYKGLYNKLKKSYDKIGESIPSYEDIISSANKEMTKYIVENKISSYEEISHMTRYMNEQEITVIYKAIENSLKMEMQKSYITDDKIEEETRQRIRKANINSPKGMRQVDVEKIKQNVKEELEAEEKAKEENTKKRFEDLQYNYVSLIYNKRGKKAASTDKMLEIKKEICEQTFKEEAKFYGNNNLSKNDIEKKEKLAEEKKKQEEYEEKMRLWNQKSSIAKLVGTILGKKPKKPKLDNSYEEINNGGMKL